MVLKMFLCYSSSASHKHTKNVGLLKVGNDKGVGERVALSSLLLSLMLRNYLNITLAKISESFQHQLSLLRARREQRQCRKKEEENSPFYVHAHANGRAQVHLEVM